MAVGEPAHRAPITIASYTADPLISVFRASYDVVDRSSTGFFRCRNHSELLQQSQLVEVVPLFLDLAVRDAVSRESHYCPGGGGTSTPYFWASATILSNSGISGGGGTEDTSVAGSPASSRNFSIPAGVTSTRALAGLSPTA